MENYSLSDIRSVLDGNTSSFGGSKEILESRYTTQIGFQGLSAQMAQLEHIGL